MGLETGTTISDLDENWPLGTDDVSQGDDHIRLIKDVLKRTFQGGFGGPGLQGAVITTHQEMNFVAGARDFLQAQIDSIVAGDSGGLNAPSGTVMLFVNQTPPPGWTNQQTNDDRCLRITSSTTAGGGTGGDRSLFGGLNWNHDHQGRTNDTTIVVDTVPAHHHKMFSTTLAAEDVEIPGVGDYVSVIGFRANSDPAVESRYYMQKSTNNVEATIGRTKENDTQGIYNESHNHGLGGAGEQFNPRYINVIKAVKD